MMKKIEKWIGHYSSERVLLENTFGTNRDNVWHFFRYYMYLFPESRKFRDSILYSYGR